VRKPTAGWAVWLVCVLACAAEAADTRPPIQRNGPHKKVLGKLELRQGDTLMFLGDSISYGCLYTQYVEDYLFTRFPTKPVTVLNPSAGGDTAETILRRFDEFVRPHRPTYAAILLGMNDGRYVPFSRPLFEDYVKSMTELVDRLEGLGTKVICMGPTIYDWRARDRDRSIEYDGVLRYYGAWLRETAMQRGCGYVDLAGPLARLTVEGRAADPDFTMTPDGIHPDAAGNAVMAVEFLAGMGMSTTVSSIHVYHDGTTWTAATENGKLTDLDAGPERVAFTFLANSLPWVLPDERATAGCRLADGPARLNRETLRVTGLEPGRYELKIGGTAVGTYTWLELARGIELQENDQTPQHQQARTVAKLNERRTIECTHQVCKSLSFLKRDRAWLELHSQNPDKEGAKEAIAKLTEAIPAHRERIADRHRDAVERAAKIYAAARPEPLTYEIVRRGP